MPCCLPYLLRTESQIKAFREQYADLLREKGPAMRDWFNGLPLYEWVKLNCRPGQETASIGILCILYIDRQINLTFSTDGYSIQRGALSEEEHLTWVKAHFKSTKD